MAKLFVLLLLLGLSIIPISNAEYLDTETSTGNTFAAGCWGPPSVPDLVSPADGSYINDAEITLDWGNSTFACPGQGVEYLYELNGVESAWQTDTEINLALTEGDYQWRVKARTDGHESAYSAVWTVTVDRTTPTPLMAFDGYSINEKVVNGGFEAGLSGWATQGEVFYTTADAYTDPISGDYMVRIGHTDDDGNEIWENKLTQQIQPGAKNLSFYYNFFSFDFGTFDDPGMIVRLNDYNVFYLSAGDIDSGASPNSSGWTQLSFDISQIPDPVLEIVFYSGNIGDTSQQSWVYIDKISTAEAVVAGDPNVTLTMDESVLVTKYSLDNGISWDTGNSFNLTPLIDDTVWYYSQDLAGNVESYKTGRFVKDIQAPAAIGNLAAFPLIDKQSVNLSWTVPAESTVYDIRYASWPLDTSAAWATASAVPNPPAPRIPGDDQDFSVTGLNSGTTYYFAIKSGDAALNWSDLSNVVSASAASISEDPDINPGDAVINELMWMGTSGSADDQYLELRNMTDMPIDLSGWSVANVTIPAGKSILPHGYFLISDYDKTGSTINVDPDLVDSSLILNNLDAQYILKDNLGNTIDTADNGQGLPPAGEHDDSLDRHWSMERDATPGNGADANVWHTIFDDSALMHSYWDPDSPEKGTPGGENLSQAGGAFETQLKLFYTDHAAGFTLTNISQFKELQYRLIYDSDSGEQAIVGQRTLDGSNQIEIKDLLLGICSAGGTCVYHQGVAQINLSVELSGVINRTLTQTLKL